MTEEKKLENKASGTENKMLSVAELKEELGISKECAYVLMHDQSFPSIKVGKKYFVSVGNLNNWMKRPPELKKLEIERKR